MAMVPVAETDLPSSYTVVLSSNLSEYMLSPMQAAFVSIEAHGAVVLSRFTDGERVEKFELSGSEVDALVATYRRRRCLLKRARLAALAELS
jgi:hypothetical protein